MSENTNVKGAKPYLKIIWVVLFLIIAIALFIWSPWKSGLYYKYAISKEMPINTNPVGEEANLNKAAELYNSGDYSDARKIMQKEYMSNPQNPLLSYYFSITLIENSQEHEARTVLFKLYEGESAFKFDAAYYIALSYLKQDNKTEAKNWLSKIPVGTANYGKAQELLKKL